MFTTNFHNDPRIALKGQLFSLKSCSLLAHVSQDLGWLSSNGDFPADEKTVSQNNLEILEYLIKQN